jgi:hypothetical protein
VVTGALLFFSLGCVCLCSHLPCTFDGWVPILDFLFNRFFVFTIPGPKQFQCFSANQAEGGGGGGGGLGLVFEFSTLMIKERVFQDP